MKRFIHRTHIGQGLVEYALILVLVALIVVVILALLGPAVGNVFSNLVAQLQSGVGGVITSVSAERTGFGNGNDVVVSISVTTNTTVSVSDSQNALPVVNVPCNGSCQVTLLAVGDSAGTVTVTAAAGGTATATYGPKS
jgi:pilus assembly protein Flp/PilA